MSYALEMTGLGGLQSRRGGSMKGGEKIALGSIATDMAEKSLTIGCRLQKFTRRLLWDILVVEPGLRPHEGDSAWDPSLWADVTEVIEIWCHARQSQEQSIRSEFRKESWSLGPGSAILALNSFSGQGSSSVNLK